MNQKNAYCNPVSFTDGRRHTNPDPYVMRWCGKYYCYATDEFGVKVSVSEDMICWEDKGYAICEKGYKDYWAPAVLYLNGYFYMYYSNIPADEEDNHEEHLKLAVSESPEGEFRYRKTFFDKFSIDAHPILWKGRLYLFYSVNDWIGLDEKIAGTCILVDGMRSPEEFMGSPKAAVLPSLRQEIYAKNRFGDGRDWYTIEGAAPVIRGDRFWLLYSANAYVNVDYYIGTAVAKAEESLLDMAWKKYPSDYTYHPLLKKNGLVEGTGHNTVTKAPNMVDDWIVYHGRNAKEELKAGVEQREMYIDPLYFNGDGIFCEGPTASWQEAPEMPEIQVYNRKVSEKTEFGKSSSCYEAEIWLSAEHSHAGARYGFSPDYQDERNYLEIQIFTGRKELLAVSVRDGVRFAAARRKLREEFDYTRPHMLRIIRIFEEYQVIMDEDEELLFTEPERKSYGFVGVISHFTRVTVHSLILTRTAMLGGEKLKHLGRLCKLSACTADKKGLLPLGDGIKFKRRTDAGRYREMFSLQILDEDNKIELLTENGKKLLAGQKDREFSLYHIVREDKEYFLADGRKIEIAHEDLGEDNRAICFYGLKIAEYQYTKNETK